MSRVPVLHPFQKKIGMTMAGQGLTAGSPPLLAYHSSFGQNLDNQLYVGIVRVSTSSLSIRASVLCSFPIKQGEKKNHSGLSATLYAQ